MSEVDCLVLWESIGSPGSAFDIPIPYPVYRKLLATLETWEHRLKTNYLSMFQCYFRVATTVNRTLVGVATVYGVVTGVFPV